MFFLSSSVPGNDPWQVPLYHPSRFAPSPPPDSDPPSLLPLLLLLLPLLFPPFLSLPLSASTTTSTRLLLFHPSSPLPRRSFTLQSAGSSDPKFHPELFRLQFTPWNPYDSRTVCSSTTNTRDICHHVQELPVTHNSHTRSFTRIPSLSRVHVKSRSKSKSSVFGRARGIAAILSPASSQTKNIHFVANRPRRFNHTHHRDSSFHHKRRI